MAPSVLISITDPSRVGDARREAAWLTKHLAFDEVNAGKLGIIVTEAANNLVKHARHGQLILRPLSEENSPGIEVLAIDKGPGMADVSKCLQDGYSTAGSRGTGLGAIQRLSSVFEVFSEPQKGTVLLSQVISKPAPPTSSHLTVGAICIPHTAGDPCGDAWATHDGAARAQILLVDGLGHGLFAAKAADEAVRGFKELAGRPTPEIVQGLHGPLRSTRGASLAVAEIDLSSNTFHYTGVGNIAGVICHSLSTRSLVSHNGTVGHELHRVTEFNYPWPHDAILVMHSDGLTSRWRLDAYPGLLKRHPSIVAGVLFRDFQRGRDDVTVLAARQNHR